MSPIFKDGNSFWTLYKFYANIVLTQFFNRDPCESDKMILKFRLRNKGPIKNSQDNCKKTIEEMGIYVDNQYLLISHVIESKWYIHAKNWPIG